VEVEALRYAPLALTERLHPRRLLVVGDINQTESERLIELTASAMNGEPDMPELWFKPHPGSPSHVDMARRFGFSVTTEPLLEIAPFLLLAVVGVAGAASVDLTLLGIPVITMLDARTPNLSPLSGIPGARFARSASQLMEFIRTPKLHHFSGDSLATRADPPLRWITLLKNTK
jgi:surface carbohydrate biosynthesis protein (TIGR04326 family)